MAKRRPRSKAANPVVRPPLVPVTSNQFEKDVERLRKRQWDLTQLRAVLVTLCSRDPLPPHLADHPLQGKWAGWRDCHVSGDWIIIYRKTDAELQLARTGSQSDLFG